jgi:hypothetical protein
MDDGRVFNNYKTGTPLEQELLTLMPFDILERLFIVVFQ